MILIPVVFIQTLQKYVSQNCKIGSVMQWVGGKSTVLAWTLSSNLMAEETF